MPVIRFKVPKKRLEQVVRPRSALQHHSDVRFGVRSLTYARLGNSSSVDNGNVILQGDQDNYGNISFEAIREYVLIGGEPTDVEGLDYVVLLAKSVKQNDPLPPVIIRNLPAGNTATTWRELGITVTQGLRLWIVPNNIYPAFTAKDMIEVDDIVGLRVFTRIEAINARGSIVESG